MTFNFDLLISCGAIVAAIPIFSWSFVLFSQFKYHSQLKEEINLELFQETNRDDLEVFSTYLSAAASLNSFDHAFKFRI